MIVRTFSPTEFLEHAGPWLEQREAERQLFYRMTGTLQTRGQADPSQKFFATIEADGAIVAAVGMTPPYHLVVSGLPAGATRVLIDHLDAATIVPSGVNGLKDASTEFGNAWVAGHGGALRERMRLGVYEATTTTVPHGVPGRLRPAVPTDLPLLAQWCQAFSREALGAAEHEKDDQAMARAQRWLNAGGVVIWEDEQPRAMANATGRSPHGTCINGVFTPPEFRRRGYASACVSAFTRKLLDQGLRFVCLFTDLSNPTSNSIYQKVGYSWVCEFADWEFEQAV